MAMSPSPNYTPSADPPVSTTTAPLSPPSRVPPNSSSQHKAISPTATPTLPLPSPTSPPANFTASTPLQPSPLSPLPPTSSPPPSVLSSTPPQSSHLPTSPNPPTPPVPDPPSSSPTPPSPNPPSSSPTPPTPSAPSISSPPPLNPPSRSSPPQIPKPPQSPPSPRTLVSPPTTPSEPSKNTPPPSSQPTKKLPPPTKIPQPPEESNHPQSPPLPPGKEPPEVSPPTSPTPIITPPPLSPHSPPSSTIPHNFSHPSPGKRLSPPPHSLVPSSSNSTPSLSKGPIPISGNLTTKSSMTPLKSADNASIGVGGTIAISLVLGLILLSLIGTAVWCVVRKQKRKFVRLKYDNVMLTSLSCSPKSDSALLQMQTPGAHNGSGPGNGFVYSPAERGALSNSRFSFTYQELVNATNGFSSLNLLGEGGFGSVYKGYFFGGREVAVKQLEIGGGQGEREFKAEVEIISRVHHRHLVSLVGYCISEDQRLLVYDYVPNNNLYFHLQEEGRPVMEWGKRVKAAAGAARGIAYLHEDCHPRIIHRDIKSSNILLDNSFEAQVSDFGLAKLSLEANSHIITRVIGTFGYMAPEYASSGKLTEKSDVYSFGVVLLELITGRKPVDTSQPSGDESLVEWARPLLNHALDNKDFKALADPRLEKNYVDSEMFRIIEIAAACVQHSADKRPRMGQVVRAFDSMAYFYLTNGMRVGESEVVNSAQQSAEIRLFQRMALSSQDYSTNPLRQNGWNS